MRHKHADLIQDLGMKPVGSKGLSTRKGIYKCHCGNEFEARASNIKSGNTKGCGCLRGGLVKHGLSSTKEYSCWLGMRNRCCNQKSPDYENYGGRGINVCARWINSFENFYSDMRDCPEGFSLDRIDVNGNYEPGNCRWADNSKQAFNTKIYSSNTSGVPGVHFHSDSGKYKARISKNGKRIELGHFKELKDAIKARHEAEIFYFGELKIKMADAMLKASGVSDG